MDAIDTRLSESNDDATMYTDPKQWRRIRNRVLVGCESRRYVSETEGLSRNTLQKMLLSESPPDGYHRKSSPPNSFGDLYPFFREMLDSNRCLPRSSQLTGTEIFLRLKEKGYQGSASTVRTHMQLAKGGVPRFPWHEVIKIVKASSLKDATRFLSSVMRFEDQQQPLLTLDRASWLSGSLCRASSKEQELKQRWMEWLCDVERGKFPSDLPLSATQLADLVAMLEPDKKHQRHKALAVLAKLSGFSTAVVSIHLGHDRRTVHNYLRDFEIGGISSLITRKQRSKKSDDPEFKKVLFALLHEPPTFYGINRTTWKQADLRRVLAEKGHPACSGVISKSIKEAGFRWRSAKVVLTSTDPQYREKLDHIKSILATLAKDERFFSIDEYGPFAVKLKAGRVLVTADVQPSVPQWQKSKGCIIMTAALELSTNQISHFYSTAKNTDEMIRMAKVLIEQYADCSKLFLSWDAASWHISKKLSGFIAEHNAVARSLHLPVLELAPLPASAQFLNIIESVFSGMSRAIIHSSNYMSVDAAKQAIDRYFIERNAHFLKHPKRAGKSMWGKERASAEFSESNNCKDPAYR